MARIAVPTNDPIHCAITYGMKSAACILPASRHPSDTAGLIWHPDILPMLYAIATITRPKANAVKIYPLPDAESQPTSIAVPQPKVTSTAVPISSAMYFFMFFPPH